LVERQYWRNGTAVAETNFVIALSDELVGAVGFSLGNHIERVGAEVVEQRANRNA